MVASKRNAKYFHNDSGKCVLYVSDVNRRINADRTFIAAQTDAIKNTLPLAIVVCVQITGSINDLKYAGTLASLEHIEARLAGLNIPLIVLIGDPLERLPGMIHHTQPRAIYFDSILESMVTKSIDEITKHVKFSVSTLAGSKTLADKLAPHPVTWPGVVLPIKQLRELF